VIPRLPKGFTHPMAIGEGSFSSVYRARQQVLDRWVAVKILHEKDAELRRKLLDEARTQARLSLPCIPAIYDAFSRGPRVFLVMEWIKGVSLRTLLERGALRPSDRAALASSLVAALAELHKRGFAHRDIKPANILVSTAESAYLVDFGFAKQVGEGGRSIAGVVKGTPAYMAPEVWRGDGSADLMRADLYSLGRVLAELDPGPPWSGLAAPLLAVDPARRPGSAAAFWEAWHALPSPAPSPAFAPAIAGLASEALSRLLFKASQQLLMARRRDEAYWLLAEALQEDPDYQDALKLMEAFPKPQRGLMRNRKAWAAGAAVGAAAALALGYFAGREAERHERIRPAAVEEETRALLLPGRPGSLGSVDARFLDLPGAAGRLAGTVFLAPASACDSVLVDGKARPAAVLEHGLPLAPGEHAFACAGAERPERVSLLPFQRKILRLKGGAG
jgi:serine/threonine protein kinase